MNKNSLYERDVKVPEGLEKDLSDMIDSMDAAEKIISSGKSPARVAMTYIMSTAAGIILAIGIWMTLQTFRTPKDTFTDPELAYAEVQKALVTISEKMNPGLEKAQSAEMTLEKGKEKLIMLYRDK